jgi:hypothetical protein
MLDFSYIEKFTTEDGRGNVTLNIVAQAVKFDFGVDRNLFGFERPAIVPDSITEWIWAPFQK